MMMKRQIKDIFERKGILSSRSGLARRPYNWKSRFDSEAQAIWKVFASSYRSEAEAWFCLCRDIEAPICSVCGSKPVVFTGMTKYGGTGFNTVCEDCSANQVQSKKDQFNKTIASRTQEQRKSIIAKRRATNKRIHGDENFMLYGSESFKDNLEKKHGSRTYNNREQFKGTCLDRYGVESNLLIPETRDKALKNSWSPSARAKRTQTVETEYGVSCVTQALEVQQNMQATKKLKSLEIEKLHDCTRLSSVVKKYGQGFKSIGLEYLRFGRRVFVRNSDIPTIEKYVSEGCHTNGYISKCEKEVLDFVKTNYHGTIEENNTSVVPNENYRFFELDIWLPDLKLAIDFNGTYWHSTKFKDKQYHQRKTKCCRNAGIQILHIYEDQWRDNRSNTEKMILECLAGTYINGYLDDGLWHGINDAPVFGDSVEIISISEPQQHQVGKFIYYDSGLIVYRRK